MGPAHAEAGYFLQSGREHAALIECLLAAGLGLASFVPVADEARHDMYLFRRPGAPAVTARG